MLPQLGALVRVRSRQYLVEEVFPPNDGNSQTLTRLSFVDDDAQGTNLAVLWEKEVEQQPGRTWLDADLIHPRGFLHISIPCVGISSPPRMPVNRKPDAK
jgi:hypothetical protein